MTALVVKKKSTVFFDFFFSLHVLPITFFYSPIWLHLPPISSQQTEGLILDQSNSNSKRVHRYVFVRYGKLLCGASRFELLSNPLQPKSMILALILVLGQAPISGRTYFEHYLITLPIIIL